VTAILPFPPAKAGPEGRATLRRELRGAILEMRGLVDGFAFRVEDHQGVIQRLVELLTFHSRTRRFRLVVGPTAAAGGRWVLCTGPLGLKDRLWHELARPRLEEVR
jgi:hypothetical protein